MKGQENYNTDKDQEEEINLRDILDMVLLKWHWFVLSAVICLIVAYLYLNFTAPTYTRTATVLIKDEKKGGTISEMSSFMELNMLGGGSNVENEVFVFKSKKLMQDVIIRLKLNINYSTKKMLRTIDLYGQSPVEVEIVKGCELNTSSFIIKPLSDTQYELFDFDLPNIEYKSKDASNFKKTLSFNDTVSTPSGIIVVKTTNLFTKETIGEKIKVSCEPVKKVAMIYQENVGAAPTSKTTSLIKLSLNDTNIQRAEDFLNTLITMYNEDAINDKNLIAESTSKFINERLVIIGRELGDVDQEIETYKKDNNLTDITTEAELALETSTKYKSEYIEVENQINVAKFIREYLIDFSKSKDLIPANTGISDTGVEKQIALYNESILKRDKLSNSSSEKNPVVLDLNNSLSSMKKSIIHSIDNLLTSLDIKRKNLLKEEKKTTNRIESVPSQEKYVLTVVRQQKIKEELYLFLLNKREENALSMAITESNARIIDEAFGTDIPVAPKKAIILLAALLIGCAIPAIVLFITQSLNITVRGRKDIEDTTTIPFLGEIPLGDKGNKETIVVKESGRDAISEAFRIMRTNMDFMSVKGQEIKTVMFTSANPGSGKTFVSINLAMSFALTSKRVILVDTDIRKGTMSKQFQGGNTKGLTNYLSGKINSIDNIISKGELHSNLDVIHAGPVPPNPAELLLSKKLDHLIDTLKQRYDYIIIDNVPATVVADAVIVNRLADLTIYVIREGIFDRRMLPVVEKLYRTEKFNNMSIVLNGARSKKSGYGYGYGYGNENDKKKSFHTRLFSKKDKKE